MPTLLILLFMPIFHVPLSHKSCFLNSPNQVSPSNSHFILIGWKVFLFFFVDKWNRTRNYIQRISSYQNKNYMHRICMRNASYMKCRLHKAKWKTLWILMSSQPANESNKFAWIVLVLCNFPSLYFQCFPFESNVSRLEWECVPFTF